MTDQQVELWHHPIDVSAIADQIAGASSLAEYRQRVSAATLRAQDADIALFCQYLASVNVRVPDDLATNIAGWQGITFGFIAGFNNWQLADGFTLTSINRRLATLKRYLALAMQAHIITPAQFTEIMQVKGYRHREAVNVDRRRQHTSKERKKAAPLFLNEQETARLLRQPDTPMGRRDAAIMAIFLGLGLRCMELAPLTVEAIDRQSQQITFYRPKVNKTQTHKLPYYSILEHYLADRPQRGRLWCHFLHDLPIEKNLRQQDIYRVVARLGASIGVEGLGPHDLRHTWAENAVRHGTTLENLMEAGGWSSMAMPLRYIKRAAIANQGVIWGRLDDE